MEHQLIVFIVEICRWIDRRFLKSLKQAIPDLENLLVDPRGMLAGRDVTIGPAKKYVSGMILGLIAGAVADALVVGIFVVLNADVKPAPGPGIAFYILLLALPVVCLWGVFFVLRGGRIVLNAWGAELSYRSTLVRCPWALFNTPGHAFLVKDRVLVPVAEPARRFVEVHKNGILQVGGEIDGRPLRFKASGEAVFYPLYEVKALELAGFLLDLGRAMNAPLPDFSPVTSAEREAIVVQPAAALDGDGWITAQLTRLLFPPFCCNCGTPTQEVQEFRGHGRILKIGSFIRIDSGEHARIAIPICRPCRKEIRSAQFRSTTRGGLIGFTVTLLLSVAAGLLIGNAAVLCFAIPVVILGLAIGLAVGKQGMAPVELERYSSARGTIMLRFRWREYGERLVAFLETQEIMA